MNQLPLVLNYLRYYITAQTQHDIHSTFFFDFTVKVLNAEYAEKDSKAKSDQYTTI